MIVGLAENHAKYHFLNLMFIFLFVLLLLLPFIFAVLEWFFSKDATSINISKVKSQRGKSANEKIKCNNVVHKSTSVT